MERLFALSCMLPLLAETPLPALRRVGARAREGRRVWHVKGNLEHVSSKVRTTARRGRCALLFADANACVSVSRSLFLARALSLSPSLSPPSLSPSPSLSLARPLSLPLPSPVYVGRGKGADTDRHTHGPDNHQRPTVYEVSSAPNKLSLFLFLARSQTHPAARRHPFR